MNIRSQLRISSVSHTMYWLSTFFADFLQYLIAMILAVVIVVAAEVGGALVARAGNASVVKIYILAVNQIITSLKCLNYP